jgi:hypothetical protein
LFSQLLRPKHDKKIALKSVLETINPDKNRAISGLSADAKVSFLSMPDVSNDGQIA